MTRGGQASVGLSLAQVDGPLSGRCSLEQAVSKSILRIASRER